MVCSYYHLLLVCLVFAIPTISGIEYTVTNNARGSRGGRVFEEIIGADRAKSSMQAATYFIWLRVFDQQKESDRKQVREIKLVIQPTMDHLFSIQNTQQVYEIHINAQHFETYIPQDTQSVQSLMDRIAIEDRLKFEFNWIITFGEAYTLQWTANDVIPAKLRNAIAAVAVLETHRKPHDWPKAGEGNTWDENYVVMAQLFYYINKKKPYFVAELNGMMQYSYNQYYIEMAAGKPMAEWWKRYKEDNHHA